MYESLCKGGSKENVWIQQICIPERKDIIEIQLFWKSYAHN